MIDDVTVARSYVLQVFTRTSACSPCVAGLLCIAFVIYYLTIPVLLYYNMLMLIIILTEGLSVCNLARLGLLEEPGKWQNWSSIPVYSSSCAAWDETPTSPFASSCLLGSDWCSRQQNRCILPTCYVSSDCPGRRNEVYDACMSAPDCDLMQYKAINK